MHGIRTRVCAYADTVSDPARLALRTEQVDHFAFESISQDSSAKHSEKCCETFPRLPTVAWGEKYAEQFWSIFYGHLDMFSGTLLCADPDKISGGRYRVL